MKRHAADANSATTTPLREVARDRRATAKELRVGRALLDTTWRMATPVIVLAGIGIVFDLRLGTKPWLTLAGAVAGFIIAFYLITLLLRDTEDGTS